VQAVFGGSFDSFGSLDTLLPSLSSFSFLSFLLFSSLFPPLLFSPLFLLFRHKPQKIAISLTKGTTHHDSLPGMWNDWCSNDYLHADFARVIGRIERFNLLWKTLSTYSASGNVGIATRIRRDVFK
jgi:hypothetical protein